MQIVIVTAVAILVLSAFVFLYQFPQPVIASQQSWEAQGWLYRDAITVSQFTGADVGYQIQVVVCNSSGQSRANTCYIGSSEQSALALNFGDIRFYDGDGNQMTYWLQSCTNTAGVFWVKIDGNLTDRVQNINMYWGNPNEATTSNGNATFTAFDNFQADSSLSPQWTIHNLQDYSMSNIGINLTTANATVNTDAGGIIWNTQLPTSGFAVMAAGLWSNDPSCWPQIGVVTNTSTPQVQAMVGYFPNGNLTHGYRIGETWNCPTVSPMPTGTDGNWYIYQAGFPASNLRDYAVLNLEGSARTGTTGQDTFDQTARLYGYIGCDNGQTFSSFSWFAVRNYVNNSQPNLSFSGLQTQSSNPPPPNSGRGWANGYGNRIEVSGYTSGTTLFTLNYGYYTANQLYATGHTYNMVKGAVLGEKKYIFVSHAPGQISAYRATEQWDFNGSAIATTSGIYSDFYVSTFPNLFKKTIVLCGTVDNSANCFIGAFNIDSEQFVDFQNSSNAAYLTCVLYVPTSNLFYITPLRGIGSWNAPLLCAKPENLFNMDTWVPISPTYNPAEQAQAEPRIAWLPSTNMLYDLRGPTIKSGMNDLASLNLTSINGTQIFFFDGNKPSPISDCIFPYLQSNSSTLFFSIADNANNRWHYYYSNGTVFNEFATLQYVGHSGGGGELHGNIFSLGKNMVIIGSEGDGNSGSNYNLYLTNGTCLETYTGTTCHFTDNQPVMDGNNLVIGGEVCASTGGRYLGSYITLLRGDGHLQKLCKPDFSDIYLTASDGVTSINFHIASQSASNYAQLVVDTNQAGSAFYVYFNKPTAFSSSNPMYNPTLPPDTTNLLTFGSIEIQPPAAPAKSESAGVSETAKQNTESLGSSENDTGEALLTSPTPLATLTTPSNMQAPFPTLLALSVVGVISSLALISAIFFKRKQTKSAK